MKHTENYNRNMIRLARESRGLTQSELCDQLGMAQGTISKIENDEISISEELIQKISSILNYPINFFLQNAQIYPPSLIYYRRKVKVARKILDESEAKMNIIRISIERLLYNLEMPEANLIDWDVERNGSPEQAAMFLREKWKVPKGRIENLIKLVEDNGIAVIFFDFGTDKLEGLSLYTSQNQPVIFLNNAMPSDRQRLTLAHELGHLVMHFGKIFDSTRDLEVEAFRFGSEFLFPVADFKKSVTKIDLLTLANLKRYWGLSMQSLIVKAKNHNMITPNQEKYLWSQISANGYKKVEPVELNFPKEKPSLIRDVIELYKSELKYDNEDIAQMLCLNTNEFVNYYLADKLRIIRNN